MLSTLIIVLLTLLRGDSVPPKPVLLLNGTVHLAEGGTIANAALAMAGDSISLLGDARVLRIDKSYYQVVDTYGQHIYPARVMTAQDTSRLSTEYVPAVSLEGNKVLIPHLPTKKDQALCEGVPATLLITDAPIDGSNLCRVIRAFVVGQEVVLPRSPAHKCLR